MLKRLGVFVASILAACVIFSSPQAVAEAAMQKAAADFTALPVSARYKIQELLIAAGYSNSVSNETFSTRTYAAITRFQSENGFAATGTLTAPQLVRLQQVADPVLNLWGLSVVKHPRNGFPLWVPSGLGLQKKITSEGETIEFTAETGGLFIALNRFTGLRLRAAHAATLNVLKKNNRTVNYDVIRSNFFVVSTADANYVSYTRYEVGPSSITGFMVAFNPSVPIYGNRLTALMSDLFRSAAAGVFRSPPAPTLETAAAKPIPEKKEPERRSSASQESGPSSGSGFFVSSNGDLLTNAHVVDGCKSIRVSQQGVPPSLARLVAKDVTNDLALLRVDTHPASLPAFRTGARVGESIAAYGFPLSGILATNGNFTTGNITATAGLLDDSRMLQVSSPVQPGNSGGPLLDQSGNIIGIVVAKLNALKFAAITKDVPQNINFAIKASVAKTFLETNGVSLNEQPSTTHLPPEDIADQAKSFSAFVLCE